MIKWVDSVNGRKAEKTWWEAITLILICNYKDIYHNSVLFFLILRADGFLYIQRIYSVIMPQSFADSAHAAFTIFHNFLLFLISFPLLSYKALSNIGRRVFNGKDVASSNGDSREQSRCFVDSLIHNHKSWNQNRMVRCMVRHLDD